MEFTFEAFSVEQDNGVPIHFKYGVGSKQGHLQVGFYVDVGEVTEDEEELYNRMLLYLASDTGQDMIIGRIHKYVKKV